MKPVSPVFPGAKEVVYAKDQPQYIPLPAHRSSDGVVTTRWKLSLREKFHLLFGRPLYLQVMTFNSPLQPVKLTIDTPDVEREETEREMSNIITADFVRRAEEGSKKWESIRTCG